MESATAGQDFEPTKQDNIFLKLQPEQEPGPDPEPEPENPFSSPLPEPPESNTQELKPPELKSLELKPSELSPLEPNPLEPNPSESNAPQPGKDFKPTKEDNTFLKLQLEQEPGPHPVPEPEKPLSLPLANPPEPNTPEPNTPEPNTPDLKPPQPKPSEPNLPEPNAQDLNPPEPEPSEPNLPEPNAQDLNPPEPEPSEPNLPEPNAQDLNPPEPKPLEPNPSEANPPELNPSELHPPEPGRDFELTEPDNIFLKLQPELKPGPDSVSDPENLISSQSSNPPEPNAPELKPQQPEPSESEPIPSEPSPPEPNTSEPNPTEPNPTEPPNYAKSNLLPSLLESSPEANTFNVDAKTARDWKRSNPGHIDDLFQLYNDLQPDTFVGLKMLWNKCPSKKLQITHNLSMGNKYSAAGYRCGLSYFCTNNSGMTNVFPSLVGEIDTNGDLNASIMHWFSESLRCNFSSRFENFKLISGIRADYFGRDFTASLSVVNPKMFVGSSVWVAQFLQAVTKRLVAGAELSVNYGPTVPWSEMGILSVGGSYTAGNSTWSAMAGVTELHMSYYHRLSKVLQYGIDIKSNHWTKETLATFCYKYNMTKANIILRASVDTNWNVCSVLEKRLHPVPFSFLLSAHINHARNVLRLGCGIIMD